MMEKNIKIKKILLIASVLLAVFFSLRSLGKKLILPFPAYLEFNEPNYVCQKSPEAVLVVDSSMSRLLFLDGDFRLKRMMDLEGSAEIDRAICCADDGQYFYVSGVREARESDSAWSERIVRFDHDGKHPLVITELSGNGDITDMTAFTELCEGNGVLYLTEAYGGPEGDEVTVTGYESCNAGYEPVPVLSCRLPEVYSTRYDPASGILYLNDRFGRLFTVSAGQDRPVPVLPGAFVDSFFINQDGSILWADAMDHGLHQNEDVLMERTRIYYGLYRLDGKIGYDHMEDTGLTLFDPDTGLSEDIGGAGFSFPFWLDTFVSFLSIVWLAVLLLAVLIRAVRGACREKDFAGLKRTGIVTLLILGAVFAALFYTARIVAYEKENVTEEIRFLSGFIAKNLHEEELEEALFRPSMAQDPEAIERIRDAQQRLEEQYGPVRDRENGVQNGYLGIWKQEDGKSLLVYETSPMTHLGYADLTEEEADGSGTQIQSKSGPHMYYASAFIRGKEGEVIGKVTCGQSYEFSNESVRTFCRDIIIALLTVFIAVYILLTEAKAFACGILEYRKKRKEKAEFSPEALFLRSTSFLFFSSSLIDSIVIVRIAKNILEASGMETTPFLLALPALLHGIGNVVGLILFAFLIRFIAARTICLAGCLGIICGYAGMVWSVETGNFAAFCVMKAVVSVLLVQVLGILRLTYIRVADEKERYLVSKKYSLGRTTGIIFGALLSGFVIQNFRSCLLYAAAILLTVLLLLFMMRLLPKNIVYAEKRDKASGSAKRVISFFCSGQMIAFYLLAVLPFVLIQGYHGYLFPIYSMTVNLPASYTTSFFVFSRVLLLMLSGPMENLLNKVDHYRTVIYGIFLIGIAFLGFAVSASIEWALIMLVITGTAEVALLPARNILWIRQAKADGISTVSVSGVMNVLDEGVEAMKETVISLFLLLGSNPGCAALGVFCIVCITAFALITAKKPMSVPTESE